MKKQLTFGIVLSVAAIARIVTYAQQSADSQTPEFVTTISLDGQGAGTETRGGSGSRAFHPSRVLVRFRTAAQREFVPGSLAATDFPGDPSLHLVQNPPGLTVAEALRSYRANPNVLYAEPDYAVQTTTTPSDPLWNQQWDMVKIAAPTAWSAQTNNGDVVVAVIDTGLDFTHPDLQSNLWTNTDGSHGFVCKGKCVPGGPDDFGHGTHVAGTIGAAADNGVGIAGINWKVQLLSLKFLDSTGNGNVSDAILAFDQVTALKKAGVNIRITNNSWGSGGFSQALKDAMSRGEAAGILHVCAAGNSGQNADSLPMYPAAFDNRGIISVVATDKNDVAGSFTNYGLASADIAAPGVSTLSTVPTGNCKLCDKSGYKTLSGTSMATPHVAGVLAALFHQNPTLTAAEARDIVLDRASYDALTDTKAKTTSTGGRLNFAKVAANPLASAPVLNNFPVLTVTPDVLVSSGNLVTLTATAVDRDNDPLRMAWSNMGTQSEWLVSWAIKTIFPAAGGSSFVAPAVARTTTVPYAVSVADGRGGSSERLNYVTVAASPSAAQPLSGTLTVSPTSAPAGSPLTVSFPTNEPGQTAWDLWAATKYAATGACCFTGSSTTVTFTNAGVYRISTQAIDHALNLSARPSVVVRIGGATGEPPIASAIVDKLTGRVPLTVNIDMSGSVDPEGGRIPTYLFGCEEGSLTRSRKAQGSCTFTTPGVHWIKLLVQNNSGYVDQVSAFVVATP